MARYANTEPSSLSPAVVSELLDSDEKLKALARHVLASSLNNILNILDHGPLTVRARLASQFGQILVHQMTTQKDAGELDDFKEEVREMMREMMPKHIEIEADEDNTEDAQIIPIIKPKT